MERLASYLQHLCARKQRLLATCVVLNGLYEKIAFWCSHVGERVREVGNHKMVGDLSSNLTVCMYVRYIRCEVQLLYYLVQSAHGYMFSLSTNKYHLPLLAAPFMVLLAHK